MKIKQFPNFSKQLSLPVADNRPQEQLHYSLKKTILFAISKLQEHNFWDVKSSLLLSVSGLANSRASLQKSSACLIQHCLNSFIAANNTDRCIKIHT